MVKHTVQSAYRMVKKILHEAGIAEAAGEANLLLQKAAGLSRFEDGALDAARWQVLQQLAERRAKRYPLQYLLGSWPFMELELEVGPGVLVPRPETEEVCLAALATLEGVDTPAVLDLCAGTGALALGIASNRPDAVVGAVEWDTEAYAYLVRNIENCKKQHGIAVRPVKADALGYWQSLSPASLHLVVSNPPYVTKQEYTTLAPELYYEPKQALVAEEDGLLFYQAISSGYWQSLVPGGALVFEIGAGQGSAVKEILETDGYTNVNVQQDMAGHDRIVKANKPK